MLTFGDRLCLHLHLYLDDDYDHGRAYAPVGVGDDTTTPDIAHDVLGAAYSPLS